MRKQFIPALTLALLLGCAAADQTPPPPTRDATTPPSTDTAADSITIVGTVTGEGVECPAVRTADNKLYTITAPDRSQLRPGTRVRITGTIAGISICQQGTTISAEKIEVLPAP
jgi:hypothetical protein